ncbi:hypothetical protein FGCSD_1975 [Streptococcus dysgalactiae]|nr:hypothetical protein FGCSD_1975 [Streptococcus dysgalactiae]
MNGFELLLRMILKLAGVMLLIASAFILVFVACYYVLF